MTKQDKLEIAESLAIEHGNSVVFFDSYREARQNYDIETSIEMALTEQNLLSLYKEIVQ